MVYQVCEAGWGLVRQQVGEKIPGAGQRQLSHTDGKTDKPRHIVPTEHDLSHTGVKTNTLHKAVGFKQKRLFFPTETTNLFITHITVFTTKSRLSLCLNNHPCSSSIHPSHVHHVVKLSLVSPVGIVNVPLLVQALTHSLRRAWQGEISVWKLEGAVSVCLTRCLLGAGVVQVCELQLARHSDKLPGLEVQQSHRAQRRLGEEVEQPDQVQTNLGGDETCQNLIYWIDDC